MSRYSIAVLVGALSISATSCRSNCASRQALTSSNSSSGVPYSLTSGGSRLVEGCYDPITGRPVPCPPTTMIVPGPGGVIPGGTFPPPNSGGTRPDELPFPSPSDNIPRPGVPYAPPMPAPSFEGSSLTPKGSTTPVKANPKQ